MYPGLRNGFGPKLSTICSCPGSHGLNRCSHPMIGPDDPCKGGGTRKRTLRAPGRASRHFLLTGRTTTGQTVCAHHARALHSAMPTTYASSYYAIQTPRKRHVEFEEFRDGKRQRAHQENTHVLTCAPGQDEAGLAGEIADKITRAEGFRAKIRVFDADNKAIETQRVPDTRTNDTVQAAARLTAKAAVDKARATGKPTKVHVRSWFQDGEPAGALPLPGIGPDLMEVDPAPMFVDAPRPRLRRLTSDLTALPAAAAALGGERRKRSSGRRHRSRSRSRCPSRCRRSRSRRHGHRRA